MNALWEGAQVLVMKNEPLKDSDSNVLGSKFTLLVWSDADNLQAKYGDPYD